MGFRLTRPSGGVLAIAETLLVAGELHLHLMEGLIDAAINAVKDAIAETEPITLEQYNVKAITGGTDAQGEVTVQLQENGSIVVGQGAHEDILMASAVAYLNALNKLAYLEQNPVNRSTKRQASWE